MGRVAVRTTIDAPPEQVWEAVRDVRTHVSWMADAEAVTLTGDRAEGVGTTFDCATRVGPIRLVDRMEVVEWEPGRAMGVRHVGLVTGEGRFTLAPAPGGGTTFAWEEDLRFPWWLAGRLGEAVGGPLVLRRLWQGNLRRLKALVEAG
jgi:uncharacterized protein YndB with AHSA1/START domain